MGKKCAINVKVGFSSASCFQEKMYLTVLCKNGVGRKMVKFKQLVILKTVGDKKSFFFAAVCSPPFPHCLKMQ